MAFETEYQLEDVPATRVASDKIDGQFRSTSIGEFVQQMSSYGLTKSPRHIHVV